MINSCSDSGIRLYLSASFNFRTTHGSVSPWKTNVTRITINVMNRIRLRYGKASPLINNGIDSAIARDTTPRIPAHPKTMGPFQPGFASATLINLLIKRVNKDAPNVQRNRATINTKETTKPYHIAFGKLVSPSWLTIEGS